MPSGGKRAGAGRKPGSKTSKTRLLTEAAVAAGITPLEVMLLAMRSHHAKGEFDEAATIACDAAPYIHPRLSSVEQKIDATVTQRVISAEILTDDEWQLANGGGGLAPANGAAKSLN